MSFTERIRQQRNLKHAFKSSKGFNEKKNQVKWKQKLKGTVSKSKIKILFIIY